MQYAKTKYPDIRRDSFHYLFGGADEIIGKGELLTLDRAVGIALKKHPNVIAGQGSVFVNEAKKGQVMFSSESATRIDARNLLRAYYSARKQAKLEDVRFHDLRHTFATRLVQNGIDLYTVKELLGHKTITMTMRYAHHNVESLRHGVDVLDNFGYSLVTVANKKGLQQAVTP